MHTTSGSLRLSVGKLRGDVNPSRDALFRCRNKDILLREMTDRVLRELRLCHAYTMERGTANYPSTRPIKARAKHYIEASLINLMRGCIHTTDTPTQTA